MKYCEKCGQRLFENDLRCRGCGHDFSSEYLEGLVAKLQEGEEEAFSELYKSTYSWVIKMISARVDRSEIEDCAQQVYITLYNNISMYDPEERKFKAWFSRLIKNKCVDYIRNYNKGINPLIDYVDEEIIVYDYTSVEDTIAKKDVADIVKKVLLELNEKQRKCIMLYYLEGKKYSEIASILNIPENSVKTNIHKGKKKTEKKLIELQKSGYVLFNVTPLAFFVPLLVKCDFTYIVTGNSIIKGIISGTALSEAAVAALNAQIQVENAAGVSFVTANANGLAGNIGARIPGLLFIKTMLITNLILLAGFGSVFSVINYINKKYDEKSVSEKYLEILENAEKEYGVGDVTELENYSVYKSKWNKSMITYKGVFFSELKDYDLDGNLEMLFMYRDNDENINIHIVGCEEDEIYEDDLILDYDYYEMNLIALGNNNEGIRYICVDWCGSDDPGYRYRLKDKELKTDYSGKVENSSLVAIEMTGYISIEKEYMLMLDNVSKTKEQLRNNYEKD